MFSVLSHVMVYPLLLMPLSLCMCECACQPLVLWHDVSREEGGFRSVGKAMGIWHDRERGTCTERGRNMSRCCKDA